LIIEGVITLYIYTYCYTILYTNDENDYFYKEKETNKLIEAYVNSRM